LVKLVEIFKDGTYNDNGLIKPRYSLRETYVNPSHVVALREESALRFDLQSTELSEQLDSRQEFTRIYINRGQTGLDITVVGHLQTVQQKLNKYQTREVLKG
jgi:hypothetical protein